MDTSADTQTSSEAGRARPVRGPIVAGAVAALAIMAAGSAYALGAFDVGGGTQPAQVIPGDAVAFTRIDMDPSAAQKVGAFRLMDSVPELKAALEDGDPKQALFEWAAQAHYDFGSIDYARDIEPWLGDRAGAAMLPAAEGGEPIPVLAVAVTDEEKAEAGFAKIEAATREAHADVKNAESSAKEHGDHPASFDEPAVRIYTDGYALLVPESQEAAVRERLAAGRLADDAEFSSDMQALGEQGVASFWYDQQGMAEHGAHGMAEDMSPGMDKLAEQAGRTAGSVRFAEGHIDIATVTRDAQQPQVNTVSGVGDLPGDTSILSSFAGGGKLVNDMWPALVSAMEAGGEEGSIAEVEEQLGVDLPEDLATLLGEQVDVTVAQQDFRAIAEGELRELPKVAARLHTDPEAAQAILDKVSARLAEDSDMPIGIPTERSGDTLVLSPHAEWMDEMVSPSSRLADSPTFQAVVPEPDKQANVFYVNLDAFESQYLAEVPEDKRSAVQALQAVGATQTPVVDGQSTGLVRITVN